MMNTIQAKLQNQIRYLIPRIISNEHADFAVSRLLRGENSRLIISMILVTSLL